MNNFKKKGKGFTLLYAMLMGSLLVAIGGAIFNISIKELSLSSYGRESAVAFYAADSGVECALYWDLNNSAAGGLSAFATTTASVISCNGASFTVGGGGAGSVSSFDLHFDDLTYDPCVSVTVTKFYDSTGKLSTRIESYGHNNCDVTDEKRVGRAIRVTF